MKVADEEQLSKERQAHELAKSAADEAARKLNETNAANLINESQEIIKLVEENWQRRR